MRPTFVPCRKAAMTCCLAALFPLTGIAADHDFNQAVSSIEQTYHVHRQSVPFLGVASFCAHVASGGAIKGIKIAAFDESARLPQDENMGQLVKDSLGASWSMIIESRSSGEHDAVYARPHGQRMTLLVASYDHGELAVVRLDLSGEQFRKWMDDRTQHRHRAETD